jgi:ATP-GRASP peptide maturase of grasp-with-spasm system
MILIVSQDAYDASTNDLIDWLNYLNLDFVRINGIDLFNNLKFSIKDNEFALEINGFLTKPSQFKAIWIRRWLSLDNFHDILLDSTKSENVELSTKINGHLNKEMQYLIKFVYDFLKQSKSVINGNSLLEISKLEVLRTACEVGFKIPDTYIVTKKSEVLKLLSDCPEKKFITKAINNVGHIKMGNSLYLGYTQDLILSNIEHDNFGPTLIQERIDKNFEIRSFFIGDKIYSMAIFSQESKKTSIDFRQYDRDLPNRNCPYKLDVHHEGLILKLARKNNLNTGSVDLIMSKNGEINFLEINPEGQYGMVGMPCNYNLDYEIAKYLSNETPMTEL